MENFSLQFSIRRNHLPMSQIAPKKLKLFWDSHLATQERRHCAIDHWLISGFC